MAKKHYFVEQTDDHRYAVRAKGAQRASDVLDTQREAIDRVNELNPNDRPDVERVRNTIGGGRDKWRRSRYQRLRADCPHFSRVATCDRSSGPYACPNGFLALSFKAWPTI